MIVSAGRWFWIVMLFVGVSSIQLLSLVLLPRLLVSEVGDAAFPVLILAVYAVPTCFAAGSAARKLVRAEKQLSAGAIMTLAGLALLSSNLSLGIAVVYFRVGR